MSESATPMFAEPPRERVRTCPTCKRVRLTNGKCECGAPAHPVFIELRSLDAAVKYK